MIAFAGMLVGAAEKAGISVPDDPDKWEEARETHPHFYVFCAVQLARPMVSLNEHWTNAEIIAAIPNNEILEVTLEQLLARGLSFAA